MTKKGKLIQYKNKDGEIIFETIEQRFTRIFYTEPKEEAERKAKEEEEERGRTKRSIKLKPQPEPEQIKKKKIKRKF
ncbi:hypothetical protein DYB39_20820 [Providencia rettgeri]|uniref:hypothetical protein n=1 Tax=Providencia rettgeri TaxID=587 RepID=UPI000E3BD266|nr:hypothetical protein [Providencia rettgeri]RFT08033.1 hypothetical protein DYB39_20820 [Providencia rettgeri]